MSKLSKKQEMFCKEYIIDLNGKQAAIRAGYSELASKQIASENMSKPYLKEYIQELMREREESTKYKANDVLNDIRDIIDRTKQKDPKTALKGLELYGKHLKLFTDKVEHSGEIKHTMTIEEADKMLKEAGIDPDKV